MTRVHAGRRQRRLLLVLLTGAGNLGGYTLCRAAQIPAGSAYPFLAHLERAGWVTSYREVLAPGAGRPPRRFYALTPQGRAGAAAILGLAMDSAPVNR